MYISALIIFFLPLSLTKWVGLNMKVDNRMVYNSFSNEKCIPRTLNQKTYVDSLNNKNNSLIVVIGPAGTGKTMLASLKGIEMLKNNEINKLIITRPIATVEEDIGFLPGNLNKKMDPWIKPFFDVLGDYYSKTQISNMLNDGNIEIVPLVFMRGRTFKNAFIIADEMQNSSPNQMLMLTTRLGTNSKMVITGDLSQTDKNENVNGLSDLITKYNTYSNYEGSNVNITDKISNNIKVIRLNGSDIQRSKTVEQVLSIYDYSNSKLPTISPSNSPTISPVQRAINLGMRYNTEVRSNDAAMIPKSQYK